MKKQLIPILLLALLVRSTGVFQTSLYNFATTGNTGQFIDTKLERKAIQTK